MDNENIEFKNLPIGVQYMSWIKNDLHNLMLNLVIYIYAFSFISYWIRNHNITDYRIHWFSRVHLGDSANQPPLTCPALSAIMPIWRASRFSPFTPFITLLFYTVFWTLHIIWRRTCRYAFWRYNTSSENYAFYILFYISSAFNAHWEHGVVLIPSSALLQSIRSI